MIDGLGTVPEVFATFKAVALLYNIATIGLMQKYRKEPGDSRSGRYS
jgi:hypothetical protein